MTEGTTIYVLNHVHEPLSGYRKVLVAQTNAWCLSFPEGHVRYGHSKGSWLDVPKAKACRFNEDGSVTIMVDDQPFCTISKESAVPDLSVSTDCAIVDS
jgi:hypothetical protein